MNEKNGNEDYSRLIDRIKQVFDSIPYPGDENILGAPEHVQSCGECSLLQKALVGRKWQDLADDESSSGYVSHAMSFFSPSGWHYYLPGYLIQTVERRIFTSNVFSNNNWNDWKRGVGKKKEATNTGSMSSHHRLFVDGVP